MPTPPTRAVRRTLQAIALLALSTLLQNPGIARAAVTADNLLLIVNKQQPIGRQLAEHYAAVRHVPADRIVEIDVPDRDDVPADVYDSAIADVVRQQIMQRNLRQQVTCLVTFFGVPLRVQDRPITPAERQEGTDVVTPMITPLHDQLAHAIESIEALARELDPNFRPLGIPLDQAEQIRGRGAHAEEAVRGALARLTDVAKRNDAITRLNAALDRLGQMPALPRMAPPPAATQPTDPRLTEWLTHPEDAAARRQVRETLYGSGNVYALLTVLEAQKRFLTAGEGEASVDSELACLFLSRYPKTRWIPNPFHYSGRNAPLAQGMVRTARIDGPTAEIARRVIDDSVAVESTGLSGDAVLDARGLANSGGVTGSYDSYDRSIRNAATLFERYPNLPLKFDASEPLMPDHTSDHAALYCGWYAVRHYAPTVHLVPGSVAFHVASYELMSLHSPGETGWCRGLMLDGADATLGPVGEPYLFAFPPADEFLGLLMTGKLTLVETYWATIPCASWKMALIGDPLYRPFAQHPPITPAKLPEALRRIVE